MDKSMKDPYKESSENQLQGHDFIRPTQSNPAKTTKNSSELKEDLTKELYEKSKKIKSRLEKLIITLRSFKSKNYKVILPEGATPNELFSSIVTNKKFEIALPKYYEYNAVSSSDSIRFYQYPNEKPNVNARAKDLNLFSAIVTLERKLFLVGGISQTGNVSNLIITYDTIHQITTKHRCLKEARSSCAAVIWKGIYLYAIGGIGQNRVSTETIEKFDIRNLSLESQIIGMKAKRNKVSAVILNDILYIASPDTNYIERFDLNNTRKTTEIIKLERTGLTPRLITQFKDQIVLFAEEKRNRIMMILADKHDGGERKGKELIHAVVDFYVNWSQQGASKYDEGVFCVDYEICIFQSLDISKIYNPR